MAALPSTNDIPLTLRLSKEARDRLAERAAASGTDLAGYVSVIVEQSAQAPQTLEEISGPIYQRFVESGLTDDQLGDLLEQEKHAARLRQRSRQAS